MATVTKPLVLNETVETFNNDLKTIMNGTNQILNNITKAADKATEAAASATNATNQATAAANAASIAQTAAEQARQTAEGVSSLVTIGVDKTLSLSGAAADAAIIGGYIEALQCDTVIETLSNTIDLYNSTFNTTNGEIFPSSTRCSTRYVHLYAGDKLECTMNGMGIIVGEWNINVSYIGAVVPTWSTENYTYYATKEVLLRVQLRKDVNNTPFTPDEVTATLKLIRKNSYGKVATTDGVLDNLLGCTPLVISGVGAISLVPSTPSGKWLSNRGATSIIDITGKKAAVISARKDALACCVVLASNTGIVDDAYFDLADGEKKAHIIQAGTKEIIKFSSNAKYLAVQTFSDSTNKWVSPSHIFLIGDGAYLDTLVSSYVRDVPENRGVLNAYKKARQLLDTSWTALSPVSTVSGKTAAGLKKGFIYSSVKEYDKYVGWNISMRTYMTAAHNPYSLLYTEDTLGTRNVSGYAIDYHGINCGAAMGEVCNTFALYPLGIKIPWNTHEWHYLCDLGIFEKVYDQSATGVKLMDLVWEPGHANLITDIYRDDRGTPIAIHWSEQVHDFPKTTVYTLEEFNNRLAANGGIVYRYPDLYKNLDYTPSKFVAVEKETTPAPYSYNDTICTFAGDYAAFKQGEEIYINYTAGTYTKMCLYKDNVLIQQFNIDPTVHAISLAPYNLKYGMYKACLMTDVVASEPTYFEIIDATVGCKNEDNIVTVDFSSWQGTPIYAQLTYRNGKSRGIIPLTSKDIEKGQVVIDAYDVLNKQYPNEEFEETTYVKVFFEGKYGTVSNDWVDIDVI